ncbi:MAG: DUF2267 domain-containing protein, partial [Myxococcota bacterium]|nr:DUF2267 domain-containing protein [Myxococcota bacterium]
VSAVGSVIGDCIDEEVHALAGSELTPSAAELLRPRERSSPPAEPTHPSGTRSTLSEGKPGSATPVSTARATTARKR